MVQSLSPQTLPIINLGISPKYWAKFIESRFVLQHMAINWMLMNTALDNMSKAASLKLKRFVAESEETEFYQTQLQVGFSNEVEY